MAPFFFFTLLVHLHVQLVYSQNSPSYDEWAILLSMKQHWGDPTSLRWYSISSPCNWPGVTCNSGSVAILDLRWAYISGTIPPAMCQLKNLIYIDLSNNNMSGHIPACLYNCSNLERLDLSMNSLSGKIPGELFLMKRLRYLKLDRNRLYGEISTLIESNSLEHLDLFNNQLNGSIPDDLGKLYNLTYLDLSMNSFTGTIPMGLFHLRQLYSLSLGYNNLTGQLPAEMDMSSLNYLNLFHNHFYGMIPRSLGKLRSLGALDLSDNQLSGDIIDNFFPLRSVERVRLCSNRFFGKIPYEFVMYHSNDNCLDSFNLCSDKRSDGLPSCPSTLCSDNRVQAFVNCDSKSFLIFIVATVGCGIVGIPILYHMVRKCWSSFHFLKRKEEEWKMISFQKLKFKKTDVLTNLTADNLIGEGGGGKVYRVFINQINSAVAVKSISNAGKSDHRLEKEFLAEIQSLGAIRHANIVKLFCCISGEDLKLLVYQYFENMSLDKWLHCKRRQIAPSSSADNSNSSIKKLDWPKRLHIAIGAAQGLCYMHHDCNPPIIHRDIKPSNILLDSEFNAKIADFGLAKLLNRNGDTETASVVAGTFGYIAPEYAYTTKLNTKSDVYSFGVVLLQLTTGRKAVTEGDPTNLGGWAQMHYRDSNAIVEMLDDQIKEPTYLDQMISVFRLGVICTATSPSNRPSMKDCLHILQNCRNNMSSSGPMNL